MPRKARKSKLFDNPELFLKWCGHTQALKACQRFHYTRSCPNATSNIAVYEGKRFIGVVQFGSGNSHIGTPYGMNNSHCRELCRVALSSHRTAVSRILAIAMRLFRKKCPHVRLIVSYADASQGHHGGIYQAGGWVYTGPVKSHTYRVNGKMVHGRTLGSRYGPGGQAMAWLRKNVDPNAQRIQLLAKHKYLFALDPAVAEAIKPLAKPYPRRLK